MRPKPLTLLIHCLGIGATIILLPLAASAAKPGPLAAAALAKGPLRVHPQNGRYFTDGTTNRDGSLKAVYLRPPPTAVAPSPARRSEGLSSSLKHSSFSGVSATLTVNLDADILQLAEQEAKARHTTLREIVAQQVRVMARNWQDSRGGKTPVTDALRGSVKLPADFDERAALTEELLKKHGVPG